MLRKTFLKMSCHTGKHVEQDDLTGCCDILSITYNNFGIRCPKGYSDILFVTNSNSGINITNIIN